MKTINVNRLFFYLLLLSIISHSCYPDGLDSIEELDVVQTQFDEGFNFDEVTYFLIPDTVPLVTNIAGYAKTESEKILDQGILSEIEQEMKDAGYTKLTIADTADSEKMDDAVVMLVTRATLANQSYYYDYFYHGSYYWDWYYGMDYYYPDYYWGYYYPWGYPVTYSYSTGTVIIEMVDPNQPFSINENTREVSYPVRWMAIINGLAELSLSNTEERITDGIEQAFDQSEYLY